MIFCVHPYIDIYLIEGAIHPNAFVCPFSTLKKIIEGRQFVQLKFYGLYGFDRKKLWDLNAPESKCISDGLGKLSQKTKVAVTKSRSRGKCTCK